MSTIIVYKIKKRLVKSGKDSRPVSTEKTPIFSQLGKNYCPVREKYFPNWEKNIPKLNLLPFPLSLPITDQDRIRLFVQPA